METVIKTNTEVSGAEFDTLNSLINGKKSIEHSEEVKMFYSLNRILSEYTRMKLTGSKEGNPYSGRNKIQYNESLSLIKWLAKQEFIKSLAKKASEESQ